MSGDESDDPMPWQVYANGVPLWRRGFHRDRFTNGFGEIITDRYEPRQSAAPTGEQ